MKLLSTTVFSGITAFVKISAAFVATKVISSFSGPAGVALVGSLTNFMAVVLSLANGSVTSGVVKYTAEFKNDRRKSKILYDTSVFVSLVCSALVFLGLILFAEHWSRSIFHSTEFVSVIYLLGGGIVFYSLNTILLAFLNGLGYIKKFTIINGISSVITLLLTIILIYYYNISGALYALVIAQFAVFFVAVLLVWKRIFKNISSSIFKPDFKTVKNLSHFTVMAVVSSSAMPLAQIVIRNFITKEIDLNSAGIWQGLIRISDGYLLMINITLGTYFLPKLSSLNGKNELRKEILDGLKFLAPLFLAMCAGIYFTRFYIIEILYTKDFSSMESLFFWQLAGDFFKVLSWVFSYLMISKVMTKAFIFMEVLSALLYVVLSMILINSMGLQGSTFAFFVSCLLCFFIMVLIFYSTLFKR
ncbi:O-antigen translocase [Chryseobacterium foetidum]|uniref:O-antigen translocase n=1 Tax=Chryseobacterium foetidum TaxID=2951057 RepID=UPI0021C59770|nr:O-antigen translocase [Chryseobacterium foetidum]